MAWKRGAAAELEDRAPEFDLTSEADTVRLHRPRASRSVGSKRRLPGAAAWLALVLLLAAATTEAAPAGDLDKIQALADRGRTEEALRRLEDVLVQEPGQLEGQFLRGVLLAELGRYPEAERTFESLARQYPDRPEPVHNLAVLHAADRRPATAILALEELVERYPTYELAAVNLERIRRVAASDAFEPLTSDPARVQLALTARLGTYPAVEPAAEPPQATAPEPAEPEPAADAAAIEPAAIVELPTAPEPEVEAPVPAPEPVVARPVPRSSSASRLRAELEAVVEAWAAAWSQQRIKEYLAFYAEDFAPAENASREEWERGRRQRVAAPGFIEVEIDRSTLRVVENGPREASVIFVQRYRSDRYRDEVEKTLDLVKVAGDWRIRRETSR